MYFARDKLGQGSCSSHAVKTCAGADHSSRLMHTQSEISTLIVHALVASVTILKGTSV